MIYRIVFHWTQIYMCFCQIGVYIHKTKAIIGEIYWAVTFGVDHWCANRYSINASLDQLKLSRHLVIFKWQFNANLHKIVQFVGTVVSGVQNVSSLVLDPGMTPTVERHYNSATLSLVPLIIMLQDLWVNLFGLIRFPLKPQKETNGYNSGLINDSYSHLDFPLSLFRSHFHFLINKFLIMLQIICAAFETSNNVNTS
jgi:hypothetical protein